MNDALDGRDGLRHKAESLGLRCVESRWLGWNTPHRFACSQGHEFTTYPTYLSRGRPECPGCRAAAHMANLRAKVRAAGAECLNTDWRGIEAEYQFRCQCGHEWTHDATLISCPNCSREQRRTQRRSADGLLRLQSAAHAHGGKCLSEQYLGHAMRARFRCAHGHEWETAAAEVLRGSWCRSCADAQRGANLLLADGLEALRRLAAARGGTLLSDEYLGMAHRYALRCHRGHEWQAAGARIARGAWCRLCQYQQMRLTLDDAREAARSRGGLCLSERYVDTDTKMTWQCDRGHVWNTRFAVIRKGHWCPDCASMARISSRASTAGVRYRAKDPGAETSRADAL
jgi:hypothetical protein